MPEKEPQHLTKTSDWYDNEPPVVEKSSRLSGVIYFLLCAFAAFTVLAYGAVDFWALGLTALFLGIIALLWLADSWLNREFSVAANSLQIPLFGLVAIGLIQLLPVRGATVPGELLSISAAHTISLAPYLTRFAVVQLGLYLVFFAAALAFIGDQKRLRKTVFALIAFGALAAFFGILQRLVQLDGIYGIRRTADAVTFGSYVNQHHFAALMEMIIGLPLALVFGKAIDKNKWIFLIAAAVVMGMAILFTGSRGGLISLFAVMVFIIMANLLKMREIEKNIEQDDEERASRFRQKLTLIIGGMALILGFFGAVIMLGGDQSLLRGANLTENQQDASNGRIYFWQTAVKIISDYPILGTGLDSFGIVFTRYDVWNGNLRIEQAHNDYLQILADAGILGFACVAAFIFLLFKQSLRIIAKSPDNFRRSVAVGAFAGCLGILIHSLFDFPLRTPANGYIFLLLVVLAAATINYPKLYRNNQ